jgi:glycyl-tRNA synthetase beta chain
MPDPDDEGQPEMLPLLLDAAGKLTHPLLVVSNINPEDASLVIGNEGGGPRLAGRQVLLSTRTARKRYPASSGLGKVVYHQNWAARANAWSACAPLPKPRQQLAWRYAAEQAAHTAQLPLILSPTWRG